MANTLWTSYFKNGVPAPMLDSHDKEEGLCHIRLALGAALGGVGTNMMGNGRMASPPLAEGGEPIAITERWTSTAGHMHAPTELICTSRHALGRPQNCATRDVWYGRPQVAHLYVTLPTTASSTSHFSRGCFRAGGTSGSCSFCWRLRHWQRDAPKGLVTHYVLS